MPHTHLLLRSVCYTGQYGVKRCEAALPRAARMVSRATVDVAGGRMVDDDQDVEEFQIACPICQTHRFQLKGSLKGNGSLQCPRCVRSFKYNDAFVDMTLTSGVDMQAYEEPSWLGTQLFQTSALSYLYERGYRQLFPVWGFPGPDREVELAMQYLKPAFGEVIVDLSCGTGLFTRRLAKTGKFSGVIASDFSESMLEQTKEFLESDAELSGSGSILRVRADVGRLPFETGTVSAIHAGAALHCWPSPMAAMAEISRVLKPGGVFVASTLMPLLTPIGGDNLPNFLAHPEKGAQFRFFKEEELQELANTVGLQNFRSHRNRVFILFSVTKPALEL
ncbi:hypothetical protein BSKO_13714 [Bryopsis sp. KO-2023]|nr:hypothetical protein BSKO_13714 [Bryopsis sp. KO-2023]